MHFLAVPVELRRCWYANVTRGKDRGDVPHVPSTLSLTGGDSSTLRH